MKKAVKYFSLLLAVMLVLTGCGKKDAKTTLDDAVKKMEDLESFNMKVTMDMSMEAEGTTIAMNLGLNGGMNVKEEKGHMTMDISLFGMTQKAEMYTETKDGYTYTYTNSDDGWTYEKEAKKDDESSKAEIEKFEKMLEDSKTVKKVKSDKDGYTKLEVTIDKDAMNKAAKENSDLLGATGADTKNMEFKQDVKFTVYIKDGYVAIIEMDLSDILKESMKEADSEEEYNVSAKFSIELSDFNKVKVSIPEEVTKNAKPATQE